MRRLALWIEYHGAFYQGMQRLTHRQVELKKGRGSPRNWACQRSVQEELELKCSLILSQPVVIHPSGRTDLGVHATSQVVALDTDRPMAADELRNRLNAVLHPSVRVRKLLEVPADFHPRFRARSRTYHYYLWPAFADPGHPFWSQFCWTVRDDLNLQSMQAAGKLLLGKHDFSSYARRPEPGESRVRELMELEFTPAIQGSPPALGPWADLGQMVCLQVRASAFLRRMVRQLVANLVEVGRGRWPVQRPWEVLQAREPSLGPAPAPPQGLFLVDIEF